VAAPVTAEARESRSETPAREKLAKLPFDKPGQAFPVAQRGRLRAEHLEVILHEVVEDALCGIARLVDTGRLVHAWAARARCATRKRDECGRNRGPRLQVSQFLHRRRRAPIAMVDDDRMRELWERA
jgi:hypothetical protein